VAGSEKKSNPFPTHEAETKDEDNNKKANLY